MANRFTQAKINNLRPLDVGETLYRRAFPGSMHINPETNQFMIAHGLEPDGSSVLSPAGSPSTNCKSILDEFGTNFLKLNPLPRLNGQTSIYSFSFTFTIQANFYGKHSPSSFRPNDTFERKVLALSHCELFSLQYRPLTEDEVILLIHLINAANPVKLR